MTIARVRTFLSGPQIQGGGVQEFYFFGAAGSEPAMVAAVADFWDAAGDDLLIGNQATVSDVVTNIDEATGNLVSLVTVPGGPVTHAFTLAGEATPPFTQALIRWATDGVVNNRLVRGRTFIPAIPEGRSLEGVPDGELRADLDFAAEALIANAETQLVVWSRPTDVRAGSQHTVLSANVWDEFAVLRSRRD